jgi:hypothetical protein
MTRSTSTTCARKLFLVLSLAVLMLINRSSDADALAGVVRRVRSIGIWGKLSKGRTYNTNNNYNGNYNHFAVEATPSSTNPSSSSASSQSLLMEDVNAPISSLVESSSSSFFDADTYRREMTDLVYQRSMNRLNMS